MHVTSHLHEGWILWVSPYYSLCSVVLRPQGVTRRMCVPKHLADVVSWALASCLGLCCLAPEPQIAPSSSPTLEPSTEVSARRSTQVLTSSGASLRLPALLIRSVNSGPGDVLPWDRPTSFSWFQLLVFWLTHILQFAIYGPGCQSRMCEIEGSRDLQF